MSDDASVLYGVEGAVARVTINRPDRRNAINPEVVRGLTNALGSAAGDKDVRVVVLTGAGEKAFCAGADLGGLTSDSRVDQHWQRAEVGRLLSTMRTSRLPIVARLNGHALAGGFGLMLGCDFVVAAETAEMGTPEINLALWPFMITAVLQRDIPRKVALELMMTGRRMSADEAHRWGFVNRVVSPDQLDKAVDEIVSKSPLILALGKRSFYRAEDMAFDDSIDYLAGMLTVCLESEDTIEGVTAFLEKRKPEWKGR
ncbi:MAG: enoyl-CoA hydratase-related protein [Actinomycetota bacterium]|nr:enoyl-CoA hydratase-related protein [Actinomycetota bacterium]